jgi:putative phosphoribosyl transferase
MVLNAAEKSVERTVQVPPSGIRGDLIVPSGTKGVVLFAHGSGSSRFSSRNRFVAGLLQQAKFATLLLDLLTPDEEEIDLRTRQFRFDIGLLAERLVQATAWLQEDREMALLPAGYFGASTGAGAALVAAADLPERVSAVVSRGGRPDLAEAKLAQVKASTLLIVGERDEVVIELNRAAFANLQCQKKLEIVPGATHLFEEPGTLQKAARLALGWFQQYLMI